MSKKSKSMLLVVTVLVLILAVVAILWFVNQPTTEDDIRDAVAVAWNGAISEDDPAYLKEISKRSSYEITDVEEGDFCTVHVMVTGIDMGIELDQIPMEDFPKDEAAINEYLVEIIGRCPQVETETVIYASYVDGKYQITFSDTFVDAMSGKIYSYYMNKVEEIMGGA